MRQLITLGCLAMAVLFYALGSEPGMASALGAGLLFEFAFWKRAMEKSKVPVRVRRPK